MKHLRFCIVGLIVVGMVVGITFSRAAEAAGALDTGKIEEIIGIKGTLKDGEYKISVPQNDLSVTVDGFRMTPPMGLTSWVGFSSMNAGAMAMGDLVLKEDEVGPVQKTLIEHEMTISALHNHFVRDNSKVMYMHIYGKAPTDRLAASVRAVLDKIKELRRGNPAAAASAPVENTINTKQVESTLGHKGEMNSGVFKIIIDRPDVSLTDQGMKVTSFTGFNTWAAFQGTDDKAAVAGDFAMLDNEVSPVIQVLVERGIEVVAVHNHMVNETPRIFFLHYWGVGPADKLALGLKAALDQTGKAP